MWSNKRVKKKFKLKKPKGKKKWSKTESVKHQTVKQITWRRCLSRGSFQNQRYNARWNWNKKERIKARVSSRRAARGWFNTSVWVLCCCVCEKRHTQTFKTDRKTEDSPKSFVSLAPRSLHDHRTNVIEGNKISWARGENLILSTNWRNKRAVMLRWAMNAWME